MKGKTGQDIGSHKDGRNTEPLILKNCMMDTALVSTVMVMRKYFNAHNEELTLPK